ncbi:Glycoside hydrolase family 85 protein [Mycena indigotica]|uniref:Glycoside hydrolase family 85 protein n=1 Tax=Mycena indigotica TaxID=2126181 RepID=A0A8H6S5X3_9AGAR|nr:Glycoside hydrolase family 85 protein [Mycena indigotica]KAF7292815.1 Glycoside hydrolase family 85 protein [Mycena indigotica]
MPLIGTSFDAHPGAYFTTLEELDTWANTPHRKHGVLMYHPRPVSTDERAKLLVCHDYKGGYNESPIALGYTFNFWSAVDTFIYFSHHRVTVPPPGWITTAHRQGVKMLGTLIFEGSGENDCLRLLVGRLPQSKSGPASQPTDFRSLPLSPHYARVLANLADERGFDGYLLNFECPLRGGIEQTRSVAAWITLLVSELKSKIGAHAEVIWYDSVVVNGQLAWQDRLNGFNLPFFLSSTGFFTNYTWPPSHVTRMKQYLTTVASTSLSAQDIYVGIDVFGRGSHGAGGFGSYKALEHISPAQLSTAFFAPGWTWENTQDAPSFTWESWFTDERKLWTGLRSGEIVVLPTMPSNRPGEPACTHGPFIPIASFFEQRAPPDPLHIPFHSTFSPGVGRGWWVNGVRVFQREGWTDVDKQTSIGDMVWPLPAVTWEGSEEEVGTVVLPLVTPQLTLDDAWNGGSSLRFTVTAPGEAGDDAAFRCIWVPVQSASITPQQSYEATLVYKLEVEDANVDLDIALSVKNLTTSSGLFEIAPQSADTTEMSGGWTRLRIRFDLPSTTSEVVKAALGLVISIVAEDTSEALNMSLLLGQLNVYPTSPPMLPSHTPVVLWADFTSAKSPNAPLDGLLSWEVAATFAPLSGLSLTGAEDPSPAWPVTFNPSSSRTWFSQFMYFNIYASADDQPAPHSAQWIGTSELGQSFSLRQSNLPQSFAGARTVTFYVQGVDDRGKVLAWDHWLAGKSTGSIHSLFPMPAPLIIVSSPAPSCDIDTVRASNPSPSRANFFMHAEQDGSTAMSTNYNASHDENRVTDAFYHTHARKALPADLERGAPGYPGRRGVYRWFGRDELNAELPEKDVAQAYRPPTGSNMERRVQNGSWIAMSILLLLSIYFLIMRDM